MHGFREIQTLQSYVENLSLCFVLRYTEIYSNFNLFHLSRYTICIAHNLEIKKGFHIHEDSYLFLAYCAVFSYKNHA